MKKWLLSLVALVLTLSFALPVGAKAVDTNVYYNGEKLELSEAPFIENGKTYVPLRSYFQELDYSVSYSSEAKVIAIEDYYYESIIDLNTKQVTIDEEVVVESLDLLFRNNTYYAPIKELQPITLLEIEFNKEENAILLFSGFGYAVGESEGFLWKVSNEDNLVYLLGSIHVGMEDMYPLRDEIEDAFAESDVVVTEVDIKKELSEEEYEEITSLAYYTDGSTLRDHVSALTYVQIKAIAKKLELDMEVIDQTKVWFLNMLLGEFIPDDEEIVSELGVDLYFLNAAEEKGMPNLELETAYSQYKMLSSFSDEYQEEQLLNTIDAIRYNEQGYELSDGGEYLLLMWRIGNLEYLDAQAEYMKEVDLDYYNGMLTDRNKGMTDKIISYLNAPDDRTYFVIAGALHFAGPDSIIVMLEEQGYTVERL